MRINLLQPAFAGKVNLAIGNIKFSATKVLVTRSDFVRLGLNPDLHVPGLKIYAMDRIDYKNLCDLAGFHHTVKGSYPLARAQAIEAVFSGNAKKLSNQTRIIVLPQGEKDRTTLAHEIAHDILLGGAILPTVRSGFIKTIFISLYKVTAVPRRRAEANFFKNVAKACAAPFDLNMTMGRLSRIIQGELDYESMVFSGECFAYAVEVYLGYAKESESYHLPQEIRSFIDKHIPLKASPYVSEKYPAAWPAENSGH